MSKIYIYSSSTGGVPTQKNTERVRDIIYGQKGCKDKTEIVYLDIDGSKREFVLTTSGKNKANANNIYPLVFVDDKYVGDREDIEEFNETGELLAKLQG